jgi:cytoskeletal protein CcmA (bactofilin family)
MDKTPPTESNSQTTESPPPEVLKPRADDGTPTAEEASAASPIKGKPGADKKPRHRTYRPSHKATFIGLAVVIVILAVNAGILGFVLKSKTKTNSLANNGQVTISSAVLNKIGVNSSSIGDSGIELVVGPDAQFDGTVTVAGDVSIGGQLKLNSKFIASDANLTQLEAGNTSLGQLDVNGNSTLSNLSLRNGLAVTGATQLQGDVTISQLLTVNNSLTVSGNVSIGGVLSTSTFSARSLTSSSTLTIGGHIITGGLTPGVGPGGAALGSNGTVSINGNDAAGTVSINIGASAGSGTLANVSFRSQYGSVPRVVITPIGVACTFYVLNPSVGGFSIGDGCNLPPGGYAVDYIVEQ